MSDNYLNVYDANRLVIDPAFVPNSPDPNDYEWEPDVYSVKFIGGMAKVGVGYGDRLFLTDPLASGPNHNAVLTITGSSYFSGSWRGFEVLETLTTPDTTDYEFRIERRSGPCLEQGPALGEPT